MSECSSDISDIIKSEATSSIDSNSTLQEPPKKKVKKDPFDGTKKKVKKDPDDGTKKKVKKDPDDGTRHDSVQQTDNTDDHMFNWVPDTEPANYMTYLLSLAQDPPDINPIELDSELDVKSPTFFKELEDDTAEIIVTNDSDFAAKSPVSVKHTKITIDNSELANTAKILPVKHLGSVEKSLVLVNNIEITIDDKNCVLDLQKAQDMLAVLHEMYPDEKEAVVLARNEWGDLVLGRCATSTKPHESQLQKCFQDWLAWNKNKYDHSRTPFCYKCYICNKAWWTLEEFRNHIATHPNCYLKLEPVARKCNIVAFEGVKPEHKEIRVYKNCMKCGRDYDYHVTHKYIHDKLYSCDYCNKDYVSCTAATRHMTICPSNHVSLEDPKKVCKVCQARCLTEKDLSKHMLITHSVRSDDIIVSFPRTCAVCNALYSLKMYHTCWKQDYKHVCQYCNRKFQCYITLAKHIDSTEEPAQCPDCDVTMPRQCLVREHYIRCHCVNFLLAYQCPLCLDINIFLCLETAEHHMKVKHCGKRYSTIVMPKAILQEACRRVDIEQLPMEIEGESLSVSSKSRGIGLQSDDDVEIISDDDDNNAGTTRNSECVTSKVVQKRNEELTKDSKPDNGPSEIISDDVHMNTIRNSLSSMSKALADTTTEEVKNDCESGDDAEMIVYSKFDDDGTVKNSELGVSKVYQALNTEKLRKDLEPGDDAAIISGTKSDKCGTLNNSESHVSKALQRPTTGKGLKISESDDKVEIISDSKSFDNLMDIVRDGTSKVLQGPTIDKKIKTCNGDVIETTESESRISKLNLIPSTEDVTKNDHDATESKYDISNVQALTTFHEEVKNSELLDAAEILNKEFNALVKENDFLIVLDSTDSDEDQHLPLNRHKPEEDAKKIGKKKRNTYRCAKCGFTAYHRQYRKHVDSCYKRKTRRNVIERIYKCTRCNKGCTSMRQYAVHLEKHGYERICPQCEYTCESNSDLWKHIMEHVRSQSVLSHVLSDKEFHKKQYRCRTCDAVSDNKLDNFVHWEKHLQLKDDPSCSLVPFKTGVTAKQALKPAVLRELTALFQDKSYTKCCVCSKEPMNVFSGRSHLVNHLLEDAIANTEDNKLKCQICSDLHSQPESFKAHMREHSPLYVCKTCKETFKTPKDLEEHKFKHARKWYCEYCSEKFLHKCVLDYHKEQGNCTDLMQPTACPQCGKVFDNKSLLHQHVRTAHVARCLICSKTFNTRKEKNDHLFDEHKHCNSYAKCPLCDQTFRTITNVQKHVNNQHGKKMSLGRLRFQMLCELRDGAQRDTEKKADDNISKGETRGVVESRGETRGGGDRSDVLELESSDEECILLNDADLIVLS